MSGISGGMGDLSSSFTTAADVASTALSIMGFILFIYGGFAIFRAVSNNEPIPIHCMFFGLFITVVPTIFETLINGGISEPNMYSSTSTSEYSKSSVNQENIKSVAPKESKPLMTPEQWASFFKWVGYIVLAIFSLAALYYTLLLSLFYYNYRTSKKYIGLDSSFITITEYLDKIEVAISKNQKMSKSLPKFLTNKTNHMNNLVSDKRLEYKKILSSFKETLEV